MSRKSALRAFSRQRDGGKAKIGGLVSKPKFQVLAMAMSLAFAGCATTHEEDGLAAGGDLHFWFPRQWDEATAVTMFAALPNAPDDSLDDGDAPALADLDLHPLNSDMPSAYARCSGSELPPTPSKSGSLDERLSAVAIAPVAAAAGAWLVQQAVHLAVSDVDAWLTNNVASYAQKDQFKSRAVDFYAPLVHFGSRPLTSASYAVTLPANSYPGQPLASGPAKRSYCFRLSRYTPPQADRKEGETIDRTRLTMDLVAKVTYDREVHPRQLRIEPIRLYLSHVSSRNESEKTVHLSAGVTMDVMVVTQNEVTLTRGLNIGKLLDYSVDTAKTTADEGLYVLFEEPKLCTTVTPEGKSTCTASLSPGAKSAQVTKRLECPGRRCEVLVEASQAALFALPPWDRGPPTEPESNSAGLVVDVITQSKVPWFLSKGAQAFHGKQDVIEKNLTSSLNKAVGLKP
ncbi:hypothetical protein LP085_01550 [Achromobacter sp. MY14]|uniref:hypothetical protein n=1 Tax=unclassified Achromobacter TaxID=2626865 RepID=UPI001E419842|nr:hypothetical protein [Achromobacter sp. MY14]MCD0495525.1 hypothetical protein [Achromobacter sp. MY14]